MADWIVVGGQVEGDPSCERIEEPILNHLREIARTSGGWEALYVDQSDNRLWELSYPKGEMHGGGPPRRPVSLTKCHGRIYLAYGLPTHVVSSQMAEALHAQGMEAASTVRPPTNFVQTLGRVSILVWGCPQKVSVSITEKSDTGPVRIELQEKCFAWFKALRLLALWFGVVDLPFSAVGISLDLIGSGPLTPASWSGFAVGLAAMLVFIRMSLAGSLDGVVEDFRQRMRSAGGLVDDVRQVSRRSRNRHVRALGFGLALSAFVLLSILAIPRIAESVSIVDWPTRIAVTALCCAAASLLTLLPKSMGQTGHGYRLAPALPALSGLMAITAIGLAHYPLTSLGRYAVALEARAESSFRHDSKQDSEIPGTRMSAETRAARLRQRTILSWGGVSALGAMALFFSINSLRISRLVLRMDENLRLDIRARSAYLAASGAGFLRSSRLALVSFWVGLSVGTAWGVWSWSVLAVQAIHAAWFSRPVLDVVQSPGGGIVYAAELVMSSSGGGTAARYGAVAVLFLGAIAVPNMIAGSLGQWLWQKRRLWNEVLAQVTQGGSCHAECVLLECVQGFARATGLSCPTLFVVRCDTPLAATHRFGVGGRRNVIVMSSGALELLEPRERTALLAHEMAHILSGHARLHGVLQCLGRCTLVGGGFVGVLVDSFARELQADRWAVQQFGVRSADLSSCLRKLRAAMAIERLNRSSPVGGLRWQTWPRRAADSEAERDVVFLHRFRAAWLAWRTIYTADATVAYWHPSVDQRIAILETMESKEAHEHLHR